MPAFHNATQSNCYRQQNLQFKYTIKNMNNNLHSCTWNVCVISLYKHKLNIHEMKIVIINKTVYVWDVIGYQYISNTMKY